MSYGLTLTIDQPFEPALAAVRAALSDEGFGILTEIDMAATMKAKLDVDMPAQVILGACNPTLAHRALQLEESIGLLLPCNVVVASLGEGRTRIEALDPHVMVTLTGNAELAAVTDEAASRLAAALRRLASQPTV